MKRLLLLLLLLPSLAWGSDLGQEYARMNPYILGAGGSAAACADSSCTGFLVCQNFEGTGYDNSESWTESCGAGATCDEDSTSSPLRGSQSYLYTSGTGASDVYKSFTESDEIYFFVRFSIANDAVSNIIIIKSNETILFTVGYSPVSKKIAYNWTFGSAVSLGTTYYLWGYYKKGTGEDEINRAWISTTPTKPGSVDYELTTGVSTGQANRIVLYDSASGAGGKFDQVLVKTTEIGDVCE